MGKYPQYEINGEWVDFEKPIDQRSENDRRGYDRRKNEDRRKKDRRSEKTDSSVE